MICCKSDSKATYFKNKVITLFLKIIVESTIKVLKVF